MLNAGLRQLVLWTEALLPLASMLSPCYTEKEILIKATIAGRGRFLSFERG